MNKTELNVKLMAHTQISADFIEDIHDYFNENPPKKELHMTHGQITSLSAIRTCYSANKPSDIIKKEGEKYFGSKPKDGGKGSDADRLIRHITNSGHTSTLEHVNFTFAVEGLSRSAMAQLTRRRAGAGFSVQSQRYVKFGSDDKSEGLQYVVPEKIAASTEKKYVNGEYLTAAEYFDKVQERVQEDYDVLRYTFGMPAEEARYVANNAAATNLVMTANLTAVLDLYSKRKPGRGAQSEIGVFIEKVREQVVQAEPWTEELFDSV